MRSWRRFLRRKKKPYFVLSLLSLLNLILPQPAHAMAIRPSAAKAPVSVHQPTNVAVKAIVRPRPLKSTLPVVPSVKAKRTIRVVATAYTSSRDETDASPDITASGQRTRDGIIAVNGLKFGTRVRFPDQYGDKIFVVQDRMSSRYGSNHVDIWMTTKTLAKQWGVRHVRMEIL